MLPLFMTVGILLSYFVFKEAAENLIRIAADIDMEKTGKAAFLMVVTKNKVAYQMENGVYVVPLCCLKN